MSLFKISNILIALFITMNITAQNRDTENWFAFEPSNNMTNSVIKMDNWLDKPAGIHGILSSKGDQLQFEDGTPIKFWGVNISAWDAFTTADRAIQWSETLANYGVNAVRFHKFSGVGMKDSTSTQMKAEKYDRFDYFSSKLKEKGIYYGWSPIYGLQPKVNDSINLLAYDEIASAENMGHLSKSTIGLVNFAEDLQNIHIKLITNLLDHRNPYTGLRYADDPALIYFEIQNEDDIFFATTALMLEKCPTYRKLLVDKFYKWLVVKYSNNQQLTEAWGKKAFEWGIEVKNTTWHLDSLNIVPVASHGIYNYEYKKALDLGESLPVFLSDMAHFLYELQLDYYTRVKDAIRATGYRGEIISSNWQAGSGITHYLNLHADFKSGIVDRHNYFGGGTGHKLETGNVHNDAMVSTPGVGLLSTGMQQVAGATFSISEWLSLIPNEWTAEGSPIVAAYGMGLQGWDASFAFGSEFPTFTPALQQPHKPWPGIYNVMSPTQLGLYPVLARMIYRGDVREGERVSTRYVALSDLATGTIGFGEVIEQNGDVKDFKGMVPSEALAVGKVLVEYVDKPKETNTPDLSAYWDKSSKNIQSTTGQLNWNYKNKGFFTINTPGTIGVVGFTDCKKFKLDGITIETKNEFAVILISSLDIDKSITDSKKLLITTMARAQNTNMKYSADRTKLLEPGVAPILLEPVNIKISFGDKEIKEVNILDHSGNRTGRKIDYKSGKFEINGNIEHSIYYEVILR